MFVRPPVTILCLPRICGQTTQEIDLNLVGYIHYSTSQALLTFSPNQLKSRWSSWHLFVWAVSVLFRQNVDLFQLKFSYLTHLGCIPVWLTFSHVLLNSCFFLPYDLPSSFPVYKKKICRLIEVNFGDHTYRGASLSITSFHFIEKISVIFCPMIIQAVSVLSSSPSSIEVFLNKMN